MDNDIDSFDDFMAVLYTLGLCGACFFVPSSRKDEWILAKADSLETSEPFSMTKVSVSELKEKFKLWKS